MKSNPSNNANRFPPRPPGLGLSKQQSYGQRRQRNLGDHLNIEAMHADVFRSSSSRRDQRKQMENEMQNVRSKIQEQYQSLQMSKSKSKTEDDVLKNFECAICMDLMDEPCRLPNAKSCKHLFCRPCLKLWFQMNDDKAKKKGHILNRDMNTMKATCPMCREEGQVQKGESLGKWVNEEHKGEIIDKIEEVKQDVKQCVFVKPGHNISTHPHPEYGLTRLYLEIGTRIVEGQVQAYVRIVKPSPNKYIQAFDKIIEKIEVTNAQGPVNGKNAPVSTSTSDYDWSYSKQSLFNKVVHDELASPLITRTTQQRKMFTNLPIHIHFFQNTGIPPWSTPYEVTTLEHKKMSYMVYCNMPDKVLVKALKINPPFQ